MQYGDALVDGVAACYIYSGWWRFIVSVEDVLLDVSGLLARGIAIAFLRLEIPVRSPRHPVFGFRGISVSVPYIDHRRQARHEVS